MTRMQIVERASGWWIDDDWGVVDGPFLTYKDAITELRRLLNLVENQD